MKAKKGKKKRQPKPERVKRQMVQPRWWTAKVERAYHEKWTAVKLWTKEMRKKVQDLSKKKEADEKTRIFKELVKATKEKVNALGEDESMESDSLSDEDTKESGDGNVARLIGLPWYASQEDVVKFFDGCEIPEGINDVLITVYNNGRSTGGFVKFASEMDLKNALDKHGEVMGQRYIKVSRSKRSEMEAARKSAEEQIARSKAWVKLHGLPYGCSRDQIAHFFSGFEIAPNGIKLPDDSPGLNAGEAFVQFVSEDIAEKALLKHNYCMGHRCVEVFKSSLAEASAMIGKDTGRRSIDQHGLNNRGCPGEGSAGMGFKRGQDGRNVKDPSTNEVGPGGTETVVRKKKRSGVKLRPYVSKTGHWVDMRGLPFQAREEDILSFFAPLKPVSVTLLMSRNRRPSGKAGVDFATHEEVLEAMKKDKSNIQHRYIELFCNSSVGLSQGAGSDMDSANGGNNVENNMGVSGFDDNVGKFGCGSQDNVFNQVGGNGAGMGSSGVDQEEYYTSQHGDSPMNQQYNSNVGGGGFVTSSNSDSAYGNQGLISSFMSGGGGGSNSMGNNTTGGGFSNMVSSGAGGVFDCMSNNTLNNRSCVGDSYNGMVSSTVNNPVGGAGFTGGMSITSVNNPVDGAGFTSMSNSGVNNPVGGAGFTGISNTSVNNPVGGAGFTGMSNTSVNNPVSGASFTGVNNPVGGAGFTGGMNNANMNNPVDGAGFTDMSNTSVNNPVGGAGFTGMSNTGVYNPVGGAGFTGGMNNASMTNPVGGTGFTGMSNTGLNNPVGGAGLTGGINNPVGGAGFTGGMNNASLSNPVGGAGFTSMTSTSMNNPVDGAGFGSMANTGLNNPVSGAGGFTSMSNMS